MATWGWWFVGLLLVAYIVIPALHAYTQKIKWDK